MRLLQRPSRDTDFLFICLSLFCQRIIDVTCGDGHPTILGLAEIQHVQGLNGPQAQYSNASSTQTAAQSTEQFESGLVIIELTRWTRRLHFALGGVVSARGVALRSLAQYLFAALNEGKTLCEI